MDEIQDIVTMHAPTVPQVAKAMALAALRVPKPFLRENAAECQARAQLIQQVITGIDLDLRNTCGHGDPLLSVDHPPAAGHSILLDVPAGLGRAGLGGEIQDSIGLASHLLRSRRIAVSPGLSMGHLGCRVRLNFASFSAGRTYAASFQAEQRLLNQEEAPAVLDCTQPIGLDATVIHGPAFEAAREEIRQALESRLRPGLRELLAPAPQPMRLLHAAFQRPASMV